MTDPGAMNIPLPELKTALIVGCGDIGLRAAQKLHALGNAVIGVVRSQTTAAGLAANAVPTLIADLDTGAPLPAADLVFWFAPPPERGTADTRLRAALDGWGSPPRRLVYISTSAVYGDCQGRWIDEDEPLKPQSDRGRRRLDAESALHEFSARHGSDTVILRVPGIYGPDRLPLERLRRQLPVVREDESPWTNRIHADDLAGAAIAAAQLGRSGRAYNISDGRPTTMADYFSRCADLLGLPQPPRVTLAEARQQLTPAMMSFLEESKRLSNRRMTEELQFAPLYPDLASGLPACLRDSTSLA